MQTETFQYLSETFPERELKSQLDELGQAGWELVTAHWEEYSFGGRSHYQARCILKKRVLVDEFTETLSAFSAS